MQAFYGSFTSVLRWEDLDDFWNKLKSVIQEDDWFAYHVGEVPPTTSVTAEQMQIIIDNLDTLLRKEHQETYCGIVYADDLQHPSYVKIYDPHHLGSSCGSSGGPPPLPGWILSKIAPIDITVPVIPQHRQRWWQNLFRKT